MASFVPAESRGTFEGRSVRVFDLEQPRFQGMPVHEAHQPGYAYFLHRRHSDSLVAGPTGPRSSASGVILSMEHAGTHIDALCHQAENQHLHGGIPAGEAVTGRGYHRLGVEEIAPIIAPGVLLDIARRRDVDTLKSGDVVTADELTACAQAQEVRIERGDVLLVRTGNGQFWNDPDRFLPGPGMDGSCSHWAAGQGVVAVGADNMAWDVLGLIDPELDCELPGHVILLVRNGIYIIENLNLEELAMAGVWTFTFVCMPLKFVGATGSPVRPVALTFA